MKKLSIFGFLLLSFVPLSHAAFQDSDLINRSSYTTSNDTLVYLSTGGTTGNRTVMAGGIFMGVVVSSATPGGTVTFFDSVGVAVSTIGIVSLGGPGGAGGYYVPYEVRVSSGLTYTTTGNGPAGITIVYKILKVF